MLCQFGKLLYMIVRRLQNRFTGEFSGYFRCLFVVYWFVNAFGHQNVNDFVNTKICIYRFFWQSFYHRIQLCEVGNLANVI